MNEKPKYNVKSSDVAAVTSKVVGRPATPVQPELTDEIKARVLARVRDMHIRSIIRGNRRRSMKGAERAAQPIPVQEAKVKAAAEKRERKRLRNIALAEKNGGDHAGR